MSSFPFQIVREKISQETLHIKKTIITGKVAIVRFVDKDTRSHVVYAPSLEISGYGDTPEMAAEMFSDSLNYFFAHLLKMKPAEVEQELRKYVGKKDPFLRVKDCGNGKYLERFFVIS
jgi:hypothetical protein